jgi:hypothetical protein
MAMRGCSFSHPKAESDHESESLRARTIEGWLQQWYHLKIRIAHAEAGVKPVVCLLLIASGETLVM